MSTARIIGVLTLIGVSILAASAAMQRSSPLLAESAHFQADSFALLEATQIAFASDRDGNREIYVMDTDGSNPIRLTNNAVVDDQPVWSPDLTKIAFASQRDADWEIYVMDADGDNPTRLTNIVGTDFLPAWSPDGNKIAFVSERDGNLEIYVMDANGANPTRLTNNAALDEQPTWSPDGSKIIFASTRDGDFEIYTMDAANGANVTPLTNNTTFADFRPMYSPNGNKIAFSSNRDGNYEIYVMDADGGNPTRLTYSPSPVDDFRPVWSPDGQKIVFFSYIFNEDYAVFNNEILIMDANGTNLANLSNNGVEDFNPDWNPPGGSPPTITSNGGGASATINVAENGTAVTTVAATGAPVPIYSLNGEADAAKFAINSSSGALTFIAAPNFEAPTDVGANNVYNVIVRATNTAGTDDQSIAVTVTDVADTPPTITSNGGGASASINVAESGTAVTTVTATGAPVPTYSLNGGADAAKFTINSSSGALSFASVPNLEAPTDVGANNVYDVIVRATNTAGTDDQNIAVTVTDAADTPVCGGVYPAIADTFVDQTQPNTNFGADNQLRIVKAGANQSYTLLTFDLSIFPVGTVVQKAVIELTLEETLTVIPYTIAISDTVAWVENTVTWNAQPAAGTGYGERNYNNATGVVQIDITTLATRWLNGEVTPTSVRLQPGTGADFSARFVSSEGADSEAQAPKLIVMCGQPVVEVPAAPPVAPDLQAAALARLEVESTVPITLYLNGDAISFASFEVPAPTEGVSGTVEQAQWFLDEYSELFGVENGEVFQMTREADNGTSVFFRQRHNGIPILGAAIALHTEDGAITGFNGNYVPDINLPTLPELTAARAEELALANSTGDGITGDTQLRYVDLSLLGVIGGTTHLTWQVNVMRTSDRAKLETLYIDAFSGAVVFSEPANVDGFDLDLENGNNELGAQLCDVWDDNNIDWNDLRPDSETATNNNRTVYNYWRNTFGRDSYDHDGEQIEVNINVRFLDRRGNPALNASYLGCDIFVYSPGATTLDITGHEFTHAVIDNEADLIYKGQSGALNESFADIFGYFVDPSSFLIGEGSSLANPPTAGIAGCPTIAATRDMSNPPCYAHPDHMLPANSGDGRGYWPDPENTDNGGVHTNSGIHNKAAALIIAGGTFNNYTISFTGLGIFKAQWLFNNMLNNRLTEASGFDDARNAAIAEATALANKGTYGFNEGDVCSVRRAYAAVGIGFADRDCNGVDDNFQPGLDVDNDTVRDNVDNCPNTFNPGQGDIDGDRAGDRCDPDIDGDFVNNPQDNCQYVANPGQEDFNTDNEGDVCDDSDDDGDLDNIDNCREIANPEQENQDLDRFGDACDPDIDNDSTTNEFDNCPVTYNFLQEDNTEFNIGLPRDKVGDACDLCPYTSGADNRDFDKDGLGNACDNNDDNDAWLDGVDNCPNDYQTDQLDWDKNGLGYACDPYERIAYGLDIKGYRDQLVVFNPNFKIPVPICPNCGRPNVPIDWTTRLDLVLPINFKASVINSNGKVVTKTGPGSLTQILQFKPAQFAVNRSFSTNASIASPQAVLDRNDLNVTEAMLEMEAKLQAVETADDMNYYVRLDPIPGTDLTQTYPLDLAIEEKVEVIVPKLFLPSLHR